MSSISRRGIIVASIMTDSNAPDGVVGLEANPLGNRAVLLLGLSKLLLDAEVLVGLWTRFQVSDL